MTNSATGSITTSGDMAYGIYAQSVGGGGGGNAVSGSVGLSLSVGGNGASSGNGGAITIDNYGAIRTNGAVALGIFAQSIGGGGGNGGTAGSFGVAAPVGIGVGGGGFGVERQLGDTAVFGFSAAAAVRPIPYPTVQPVAGLREGIWACMAPFAKARSI